MRTPSTIINFNLGSLMPGRVVKTATYTHNTRSHFENFTTTDANQNIKDWCGKKLRIVSVCVKTNKVILEYDCKVNLRSTVNVDWPITALCQKFGIRL